MALQVYSAATSVVDKIVIRGLITSIARSLGVDAHLEDRLSGSERFDKVDFELINF